MRKATPDAWDVGGTGKDGVSGRRFCRRRSAQNRRNRSNSGQVSLERIVLGARGSVARPGPIGSCGLGLDAARAGPSKEYNHEKGTSKNSSRQVRANLTR